MKIDQITIRWINFWPNLWFVKSQFIGIVKTGFPSTLRQSLMSQSYEERRKPGKIFI